jgi:transaldolase
MTCLKRSYPGDTMKATELHDGPESGSTTSPRPPAGGTLERYINELSVTGLTSNPTIFDHAIRTARPTTPRSGKVRGKSGECSSNWRSRICQAADLFRSIWDRTRRGRLGVVDIATAGPRYRQDARRRQSPPRTSGATKPPHQDPRHQEGLPAIEERSSPAYRSM